MPYSTSRAITTFLTVGPAIRGLALMGLATAGPATLAGCDRDPRGYPSPSGAPSSSSSTAAPTESGPTESGPTEPGPTESAPASQASPCPGDMVLVDGDYCTELELRCEEPRGIGCARYARGERCQGEVSPRRFCIDAHEWPNRLGEAPLVHVDFHEAAALCDSVGKRLCKRSEWTLACEGPKRLPYPWGFERHPTPCNIDRPTIPFDANALTNEATRAEELARLDQADPIGSHPSCVSAYGVFDMVGNVDEWTDNGADHPETDRTASLNGGYWGPVRNTCRLATTSHGPSFRFYQVGFRCCAEARSKQDEP